MTPAVHAVILTLDERENIARCVQSLRWCERICVVDSGSSDGTPELARELGAEVFHHRQAGVFRISEQRNWCLDHCGIPPGDWVLFLDADETIPPELVPEIRRAIAHGAPFDGYEMTPRYLFWGRWLKRTQGFPNWHARLARAGSVRFDGGVWEHFAEGARIGRITEPYDHHANSKGFSDWLERHRRYSDWDAEKVVAFLGSGDAGALATARKLRLRVLAARLWPLRPAARFFQMYVLRGGWMEGKESLVFCLLYAFYEFMIVVKIAERLRLQRELPL